MFEIFFLLFGFLIGSFLTVCIYRLPFASLALEEELNAAAGEDNTSIGSNLEDFSYPTAKAPYENISIAYPKRSFCPKCLHQLSWYHNIPVFSWLFLMGKCSFCKARIPARYPLTEVATGILSYLSFTNFGLTPTGFVVFAFCCALIVIMVIDYDYYIIPNVISVPGTFICFGIAVVNHFFNIFNYPIVPGITESLLGVLAGAGFLFAISEFYLRVRKIEGLGMGDVKLLAMTGALFGYQCSFFTIFVGSLIGAILGVLIILAARRNMAHPIPFGPYLASATLVYIFGGPDITIKLAEGMSDSINSVIGFFSRLF